MKYKFSKYNLIIDKTPSSILLYNTFSGSFCKLETKLFETIYCNTDISPSFEFFDSLREEGLIVPACLDEYRRVIAIEQERMYESSPENIYNVIALTLACNMQCEYCFEANHTSQKSINSTVVSQIISYLKNQVDSNKNLQTLMISWFGGEPLLGFKQIVEICDQMIPYCTDRNVKFYSSMITNGLLLTEDRIKILVEKCNLTRVQITLDGTQDTYCKVKRTTPSAYKNVLDNIVCATDKVEVIIRLNASKDNFDELKKVVSVLFDDLKLKGKVKIYIAEIKDYTDCFQSNCNVYEYGEFEPIKNQFYQYLEEEYGVEVGNLIFDRSFKDTTCGLIRASNAVIGPQGELYKCEHGLGNPEEVVGTIQDGYYYNEKYNNFCGIYHFEKCKSCSLLPICLSGCRSQQLSFGEKAVDCDGIKKSLILSLLKYYNKEVHQ